MSLPAKLLKVFAAGIAASTLTFTAASAQQQVRFDKVELIIPYGPGGGSSLHGRLVASALEKHLPGNPTIVIRNIPGAGSVRGINEFDKDAKPDGKTIASIASGTFFSYVVEEPAVRYELPKFNAFLSSPFGVVVYARKNQAGGLTGDAVADVKRLQKNPPTYGGQNATSSDMPALLSLHLLGIKPRTLFGVSNNEARAGFERGELTLNYDNMASWESGVEPLIKEGTAVPLFTFGYVNEKGEVVRDPMAPHIPTFNEVYEKLHGKPLSGIEKDTWMSMLDIRVMASKMFVLPKGTPQHIIDVYSEAARKALAELQKNPEALEILGPYPQTFGREAQRTMISAAQFSDAQKQYLRNWARDVYNVKF
jgi:tripartite-type tricarboxylate transporter receptor subunit TctC